MPALRKVSERTVKCQTCKRRDFYWYRDEETESLVLVDRLTNTPHSHEDNGHKQAQIDQAVQSSDEPAVRAISDRSALIPPREAYDSYIPRTLSRGTTDIEVLRKAVENSRNVLLVGDAGTGKNHLPEAVASLMNLPLAAISLNGGTTVEDLIGQHLFISGNTVWGDGILTDMVRHGGIVVLDEVNACPPEISFVLHQLLDWRRTLVLVQKGREVVKAHKNFAVIATMNPDYRGTKPLNEAFRDRFQLVIPLDYDEQVEKTLIPGMPQLHNLAKQLRKSYRQAEIETPCSTRMLIDYRQNVSDFGEPIARQSFIARFANEEQAAVREAMTINLDGAGSYDAARERNLP